MTPVGQEHRELEIAGGAAGTFQAASWSEAGSCPDTLPAPAQPHHLVQRQHAPPEALPRALITSNPSSLSTRHINYHNGLARSFRLFSVCPSSPPYITSLTPSSDLLRRLNPKHTAANLNSLITLVPDLTEELLSSVDQPLQLARCPKTQREYLLCDYNRDGDSYRSPWSNEYTPALADATYPSEKLRKMEIAANQAFDVYRELYYEGGVSSVYFWNLDDGFAGVVLLKKCMNQHPGILRKF
jgi:hypothetical protein